MPVSSGQGGPHVRPLDGARSLQLRTRSRRRWLAGTTMALPLGCYQSQGVKLLSRVKEYPCLDHSRGSRHRWTTTEHRHHLSHQEA
jgi:hypothetical protein